MLRVEAELVLADDGVPVWRWLIRGDHGILERGWPISYRTEADAISAGRAVALCDFGATPGSLVIW